MFSLLFQEILVGGQGFDGGGQSRDGDPPVPPLGKTLGYVCGSVGEPLAASVAVGWNNVLSKLFGVHEFNQIHTGTFSH